MPLPNKGTRDWTLGVNVTRAIPHATPKGVGASNTHGTSPLDTSCLDLKALFIRPRLD
jgi:hypothetical protein